MSFSRFLTAVGCLAIAGCGASENPPILRDLGTKDFNIVLEDLAGEFADMTGSEADMKAPGGCIQLATWPKNLPAAYFDPAASVTGAAYADAMALPFKALSLEDWHLNAGETYPKMHTFSAADKYATCDLCSLVLDCTAANGCESKFFAQAGSVTVTKADTDELVGRLTASATNLKLVEWDATNDVPVANGGCYEIASMSWDIPWDDRPDMGAPGDMSGVVVDMTPPDLAGADFGTCHPVINEVLTSFAGVGLADAEFVEIYNPCGVSFTTTGWKIVYRSKSNSATAANTSSDLLVATLPASLGAGEYLLYVSDEYAMQMSAADAGVMETGRTAQPLAADGGGLALRNNSNAIIDSVAWGSATNAFREMQTAPAPTPTGLPGTSIARKTVSPIDTNNNRNDFVADLTPTPKTAN